MASKCSIVMPIYNVAPYLAEAIKSCLNQTYSNIELVIIDDGSTDSSKKIVDFYLKDDRVKYFYQNNTGPALAMNMGIEKSTGDIICFAAGDDIQEPNRVEVITESLKHADFCYTGYWHANIYGQAWQEVHPKPLTKENIKNNDCMSGGAVAGKRKVFDKVRFRDLRVNEDMALSWDLYKSGFKYALVDIPTFRYRLLPTGLSYSRKKEVDDITKNIQEEIDEQKD